MSGHLFIILFMRHTEMRLEKFTFAIQENHVLAIMGAQFGSP